MQDISNAIIVKKRADLQSFWKLRISESKSLFEEPAEYFDKKKEIPKIRFRKKKLSGDLLQGEEFHKKGSLIYSGTYNLKKQRHGTGTMYQPDINELQDNTGGDNRYIGLQEVCRCNYENGELHGTLSFNKIDFDSQYLFVKNKGLKHSYLKTDKYRLVKGSEVFERGHWGTKEVHYQEFNKGDMTGLYEVYLYNKNGDKILELKAQRDKGLCCGIQIKFHRDTGKVMQKENNTETPEEDFKRPEKLPVNEMIRHIHKINYYDNTGQQSMSFYDNGQIGEIHGKNDENHTNFNRNGLLKYKRIRVPKGLHPMLPTGKELYANFTTRGHGEKEYLSFFSNRIYKKYDVNIYRFNEYGVFESYGHQFRSKNGPGGFMGYARILQKNAGGDYYNTESDFQRSTSHTGRDKRFCAKRTYGSNGKLLEDFDPRKNAYITYNENGSFKDMIFKNNYRVQWTNEPNCYVNMQGSIDGDKKYHGDDVISGNITEKGKISYEHKNYVNGEGMVIIEEKDQEIQEEKIIEETKTDKISQHSVKEKSPKKSTKIVTEKHPKKSTEIPQKKHLKKPTEILTKNQSQKKESKPYISPHSHIKPLHTNESLIKKNKTKRPINTAPPSLRKDLITPKRNVSTSKRNISTSKLRIEKQTDEINQKKSNDQVSQKKYITNAPKLQKQNSITCRREKRPWND